MNLSDLFSAERRLVSKVEPGSVIFLNGARCAVLSVVVGPGGTDMILREIAVEKPPFSQHYGKGEAVAVVVWSNL